MFLASIRKLRKSSKYIYKPKSEIMKRDKETLRRINNILLGGSFWLGLCAGMAIIYFFFCSPEHKFSIAYMSGVSGTVAVSVFLVAYLKKNRWWNDLPLSEKCFLLARELYNGERDWYLNCFLNTDYFFAPLKKSNMNEFGGGKHKTTTKEEVIKLLKEGRIENDELTKLIIQHFESFL